MRRRVYDALNVFCAVGILTKKDRKIKYFKKASLQENFLYRKQPAETPSELLMRIKEKKKVLKEGGERLQEMKLKVIKLSELINRNKAETD